MAWIQIIEPDRAEGLLARLYREASKRAGRVFQILQVQSRQPRVLQASTRLYSEVMLSAEGPLTRAQREMIATAVSRQNDCFY